MNDHNQTIEQANTNSMNRNPTGRGGFIDNPQNINFGGRPKNQERFAWWLDFFKNMTGDELTQWAKDNPPQKRKVAAHLAYIRIRGAENALDEFKEVADRTEGKPKQSTDLTTNGASLQPLLVKFIGEEETYDKNHGNTS